MSLSPQALELSRAGLQFLAADPEELIRFMGTVGYDPDGMRDAANSEELASAVLDYFAANEPALLAMCANTGTDVTHFMRCWQALNHSM